MLEPLSSWLRPRNIDSFVWQKHLVGPNKPIKVFLENKKILSMLFWGPPGCGKTSMTCVISKSIKADFHRLSWVKSKKQDLDVIIEKAKMNFRMETPTIVFLDEIHRWNKAQQDSLLPFVEKWIIILIGATTENPSFTVINALLSRCRLFVFEKLTDKDIFEFLEKNLAQISSRYPDIKINTDSLKVISQIWNGDLRNSLNMLEATLLYKKKWDLTKEDIFQTCEKNLYYDRNSDEHYNIISAVHKSIRDGDADAACYWIQRMLSGGEDPLYVVRRLMRLAAEDIGIKDPFALVLANNVYESVQKVGMPECDLFIFELAIYLAKAPKSNAVYKVSQETKADVSKYWNLPVPVHLRNASTKLMKDIWYGDWYKYAHDYKDAKVDQEHMPKELKGRRYL